MSVPPDAPFTFRPPPREWANLARAHRPPAQSARFRSELSLPPSGVVVMSGHQSEIWHAGILAKLLALGALSATMPDSARAWIVVDQDSNDPGIIRYPTRTADRLAVAQWRIGEPVGAATDTPTASRQPWSDADLAPAWNGRPGATGQVACGLVAIRAALLDHADAPTLAHQLALAIQDLTANLTKPVALLYASRLSHTSLFADLLHRMTTEPARCIQAYNTAAARNLGAGLKPLDGARGELPLWHLSPGEPRRRVTALSVHSIPRELLAPRAILLTGLLRFAACDLFIHGTGGGEYDRAADDWFADWLGAALAPAVVATATLHLPLADAPFPSASDVARAHWRLQHARHSPGILGDQWAAERKRDLVEQITAAKRDGLDPSPLFGAVHDLLSRVRIENATTLNALAAEIAQASSLAQQSAVAHDRTWPFPLHDPGALTNLRDSIRHEFEPNQPG